MPRKSRATEENEDHEWPPPHTVIIIDNNTCTTEHVFFVTFSFHINIYIFALKNKDDNAYGDDESPLSRVNLLNLLTVH